MLSSPVNLNLLKACRTFIWWNLSSGLKFGLTYILGLEGSDGWFFKEDSFLLFSKINSVNLTFLNWINQVLTFLWGVMSTRLKISSNVTSFRKSQSRAGHSLELTIGIKKSKLVLAFPKSGRSPDISRCDSWCCFVSFLNFFLYGNRKVRRCNCPTPLNEGGLLNLMGGFFLIVWVRESRKIFFVQHCSFERGRFFFVVWVFFGACPFPLCEFCFSWGWVCTLNFSLKFLCRCR